MRTTTRATLALASLLLWQLHGATTTEPQAVTRVASLASGDRLAGEQTGVDTRYGTASESTGVETRYSTASEATGVDAGRLV